MKALEAVKVIGSSLKKGDIKNLAMAWFNLMREPGRMSSYPVIIQLEPTIHCNLECVMCANPVSGREKRHMPLAEFKTIIDGMPFLKKVSLVGAGEPLMNPEFFDMIAYAGSKGIAIGFATNGMLLNEINSRKILDSDAAWLNISIDSADKDRYEMIRKGALLDTVTKNIRRFMEMKGSRRSPSVSVWFVMMKENLRDLPDVIRLSKSLGIDQVFAQLEHNWSNDAIRSGMKERYENDFYTKVAHVLRGARTVAAEQNVCFDFVNVPQPASRRACKWPWKSCYVTVEGYVTPCCLQGSDPRVLNFGNLFTSSFSDIWNSPAYEDFRIALRSGSLPRICVDCTAYPEKMKL